MDETRRDEKKCADPGDEKRQQEVGNGGAALQIEHWERAYIFAAHLEKREQKGSAAEVVDDPNEQAKYDADNRAGDNGKVERSVLVAMGDVAGKSAEAEWEFAAKEEKRADNEQHSTSDQKSAA
ncbi:MAG TPA: hypothetical protein VKD70_05685 [Candidatus Acidoferrum sp.]|nr:hypothetical protein [Candidatus Acidoferrum sp.]